MRRLLLSALILFCGGLTIAQENLSLDTITNLNEVVVTYQANKQTPVTFLNIASREIDLKSVGQEPSFLIGETPSMTNYSDSGSGQGYSYFRLRGIDQTRINMTLDGVPINEPEDQGAYFSNYPDIFNSVSKVQIQRGIGTSKNGVASYAGSVELFSPNLYEDSYTTVGLGYGSFNSFRGFIEYNSGVKNRKGLYARLSQVYSEGYKHHSSNNGQSAFVSGGLFYDKSTWKINILAGHQQNELSWLGVRDSLIAIDRQTNGNSEQEKDDFTQCLVQLQNFTQLGKHSTLRSSLYYTFLTGDYDFDFNNFLGLPSTNELYNYAFQSNLFGVFSNYSFSKNGFKITSGIHGNIYGREHIGSEKTLGQLYENTGYKNEISFFTKLDYTFKKLNLFADVQYRYTNFNYDGSVELEQLEWQFLNPKVGISIDIKPSFNVYFSLGRTGREPTRNDLFGGNDDLLANDLGLPALFIQNPEYVLDVELGTRFQNEKLSADVNFYYMDFENEIVLNGNFGPNGLALTDNVEQSFRTGIETTLRYQINENFTLINNSSYNYSRIKEQQTTFAPILSPKLILNQEAAYQFNQFRIGLIGRFQDSSFIDFANTTALDNYFLLNANLSYKLKKWQFVLFLNNLTNTKYFNNGYVDYDGSNKYFVQAPFNFYTSVNYTF